MQMRLDAAALFRALGGDQALVALDVVKRLAHRAAVQVELSSRAVDVPVVRTHVRDKLRRGLPPPFEDQLTAPRMRGSNEIVVRRIGVD